jgi:two-component system OmpR family response regulator
VSTSDASEGENTGSPCAAFQSTTSGRWILTWFTASAASAASATTRKFSPRSVRTPVRQIGWSSATTTAGRQVERGWIRHCAAGTGRRSGRLAAHRNLTDGSRLFDNRSRHDHLMSGEHLLLVDDEENLRSMLSAALRHNGFEVSSVCDGRAALGAVSSVHPDLIVLDVMLPDLDGFEVCRRLRAEGQRAPVLFLTARDTTEDKVRGLTLGGDDYLVKPFSLEELVARVNAVLRRTGNTKQDGSILSCADVELDDDAHRVVKNGAEVSLSPTEYKLLRYLLVNQGRVLSKAQILDHVWQYDFGGDGGVVETYIGYLRRKLDTTDPRLIHTIRGVGYTLRAPR